MYNFNNQHLLKLNLLSSMFHVKQKTKFSLKNVSRETITCIVGFDRQLKLFKIFISAFSLHA